LSGSKFYGGIQTQADGCTKWDRHLPKIGPGFLMSMWGQRSPDAIRPSAGGFWQSSGHEGDFVSVRRPYVWPKGKYTYRVVRMDREVVEGKPCTWVGAFVYSHENDENIFIGALRFPGENLVLARKLASFVEIYGQPIPLEQIPEVTVTFGNLRVNGCPWKNRLPPPCTQGKSPNTPRPLPRTASWWSRLASRCRFGNNGGWNCCRRRGGRPQTSVGDGANRGQSLVDLQVEAQPKFGGFGGNLWG
jgi:hypothetical protein